MRKMMALLLSVVFLWILTAPVQAAPVPAPPVRVYLDGTEVHFDVDPVLENGRTLVPIRALSEALGFTVTWDETENLVSLTRDGTTIVLWIDSTKVLVDSKESHLEVPTRIVNGRTMVPLRFISEALGSHIAWDNEQFAASIVSDKSLRAMVLKSLQTPIDQVTEGEFLTTMTIKGDGVPGGGI
ncbi:MAG: copper amine oxidase domain protein, partial [Symbiobacteriaceae bacterium]|nr:copper amine oxidase domain protein [Symbiobacteriaceae bacterium]